MRDDHDGPETHRIPFLVRPADKNAEGNSREAKDVCRRALHKLDVDVANHVIRQVVTDIQMLYLAVLVHLLKDILIEILLKQSHKSVSLHINHAIKQILLMLGNRVNRHHRIMHMLKERADPGQVRGSRLRLLSLPRSALVICARQQAWVAHLALEEHSGRDSGTGWAAARWG